jgi:hypothetical protein
MAIQHTHPNPHHHRPMLLPMTQTLLAIAFFSLGIWAAVWLATQLFYFMGVSTAHLYGAVL